MNIGEICTQEIVFADREESLQRAAQRMREHHVGALVVTQPGEEGKEVLGIVTDRDIAIEGVAQGVDVRSVGVGRIATPGLVSVPATTGLGDAIELMKERGVRRLLVSAEGGRLLGIVTVDDLVAALGHELAGLAHALRKGIDRESEERQPVPPPSQDIRIPASRYV